MRRGTAGRRGLARIAAAIGAAAASLRGGATSAAVIAAGSVSVLTMALAPSATAGQDAGIAVGAMAPDATVQNLQGAPLQLLSLAPAGKPVLLEFWAVWCDVCEELQPQLDRIQSRYGSDVTVIAVAVGVAQTLRRVQRHLESHDPGYPFVWDANGAAVRAYQAPSTAFVVLIGADRRVKYTGVGSDQDLFTEVERALGR